MLNTAPTAPRPLAVLVKRFPKLSETFVLEEVLGLERLGLTLCLYTLAPASDDIVHPQVAQVCAPVVGVPSRLRDAPTAFAWRHARLLASAPWRYLRALRQALRAGGPGARAFLRGGWLAAQLQDDRAVHLHAHFVDEPADVAGVAAALAGLAHSLSAHAKDIYLAPPAALTRRLGDASFTVTCTEANRAALQAAHPQAVVRRMYHGIDAALFHPAHRASPALVPRLLSVGRLREKKGLDTLVLACARLQRQGIAFTCDIVGYGEQHAALEALIDQHRLGGHVRLLGKLNRPQVLQRYAQASVFVQPSRVAADGDRDGIPNVLLEALACGLPVVATRVSGIPEVIEPGRNGVLVPPDDPAALADAVAALLAHPGQAAALGRAGRATVLEHFDNTRNLQTLIGLLETLHAQPHACAAH